MLIKAFIVLFLLIIIYSLGSALYFLAHERRTKKSSFQVVKALTWRISLSLLLFVLLFVAYGLGWITPHQV